MKTNKTVGWVLTGLISLAFLGSAVGKFTANAEALKMAEQFGIDASTYLYIGIIELICLFINKSHLIYLITMNGFSRRRKKI
jgi:hypothetical protein